MGRKMYSTEVTLEVVKRYLDDGMGLRRLAKQYHVDKGDIQKWRNAYVEHGIEGLCTTHGTYTGDFKVAVVEYMHNTGASIRQTAAHFNIPSHPTISNWESIYYERGKDALYEERRGRASKMGKKSNDNSRNKLEENEDLLAEIQRLRMENEY